MQSATLSRPVTRYTRAVPVIVDAMPSAALVELVNGWGSTPRRTAGEEDWDYPPRSRFLDLWDGHDSSLGSVSDAHLTAAADRLHPVFAAENASVAGTLVNEMLELAEVRPVLEPEGDGLQAAWSVAVSRHALLAAAAVALHHQLAEHSPARLGTCSGSRCDDVYVDASPTGRRRFCGVTCQNRARVAAYRSRRRGDPHRM